ncbi:MAG: serine/threonine-protein kinase [Polyangiaceae bacterium]|jgi:serine/threonine-protein kinase
MNPLESEPHVGAIVDTRYELRRLIARGGMGLVFEAHHRFTRRTIALKLLPDAHRPNKEARGRLLREAHALTTVRHPGFVEVLDAGVCADNGPYVVLEMLEGRTLDGILAARRQLGINDAIQVGRQVCAAVEHAHSCGVIHRDLKPSNVFVARSQVGAEVVKLIDLGVAAVAQEQLAHLDRKLTTAHEVLGTPEYMAPEQLWGRAIDERTDVYGIGMTLYECLTGEVPYVGAYPDVLIQVSNAVRVPRVHDRRPDIAPALAAAIERALEKDATARFGSAAALGRALLAAGGVDAGPTSLLSVPVDDAPMGAPISTEPVAQDDPPEEAIKLVRRKPARPGATAGGECTETPPRRRHSARAPYVTPVFVVPASGRPIETRSEEISAEGMLVVSPVGLALGERLTLRFASPTTGEILVFSGRVRWTRDGRGKSALGIEFDDVAPAVRGVMDAYVTNLRGISQ